MANTNHKNEMNALYHVVKEMDEVQLRMMRVYAERLRETDEATSLQLLHQGSFLVEGSAHVH